MDEEKQGEKKCGESAAGEVGLCRSSKSNTVMVLSWRVCQYFADHKKSQFHHAGMLEREDRLLTG